MQTEYCVDTIFTKNIDNACIKANKNILFIAITVILILMDLLKKLDDPNKVSPYDSDVSYILRTTLNEDKHFGLGGRWLSFNVNRTGLTPEFIFTVPGIALLR